MREKEISPTLDAITTEAFSFALLSCALANGQNYEIASYTLFNENITYKIIIYKNNHL